MKIIAMNSYQRNKNNQTAFGSDKELAATVAKFTKEAILANCEKPVTYSKVFQHLEKSLIDLIEQFKSSLDFKGVMEKENYKSFRFKDTSTDQSIRLNCSRENGLIHRISLFETDGNLGPTRITSISYTPEFKKIDIDTEKYEKLTDIPNRDKKPQKLSSSIIDLGA